MAKYIYPDRGDFRNFIKILKEGEYLIKKYLPPIDEKWYEVIGGCVEYVEHTSPYVEHTFIEECARILYKVAKRHELGDGNKRSSVMAVYLFCILNDYFIAKPAVIKKLAKRVAATKGRINEEIMRKRIGVVLADVIKK